MSASPEKRRGGRESAAEQARRMIVQIVVGPSRTTVLTVIGSAVVFLAALAFGYLTRR